MSTSPLMRHLIAQHGALMVESKELGLQLPAALASVDGLLPPVAQDCIDQLSRILAAAREAQGRPAEPAPFDYANPIAAARAWMTGTPRVNAGNVGRVMNQLRLHMQKCGFVPTPAAYSFTAKHAEFAAWLAEQVPA